MEERCSGSSGDSSCSGEGVVSAAAGSGVYSGAPDRRGTESAPPLEEGERHPERTNREIIKPASSPCRIFMHSLPGSITIDLGIIHLNVKNQIPARK